MREETSVRNVGRLKSLIRPADGLTGTNCPGSGGSQSPCPKFVPRLRPALRL